MLLMSRVSGDREVSSQNSRMKREASREVLVASWISGFYFILFFSDFQWLATVAKQLVSVYSGHPSSMVCFLRLPTDPLCDTVCGGTAAYLLW